MGRYNRTFNLSIEDMDLIESALRHNKRTLSEARLEGETPAKAEARMRDIHELLGRLHNQKQFYRPKGVYVSG